MDVETSIMTSFSACYMISSWPSLHIPIQNPRLRWYVCPQGVRYSSYALAVKLKDVRAMWQFCLLQSVNDRLIFQQKNATDIQTDPKAFIFILRIEHPKMTSRKPLRRSYVLICSNHAKLYNKCTLSSVVQASQRNEPDETVRHGSWLVWYNTLKLDKTAEHCAENAFPSLR